MTLRAPILIVALLLLLAPVLAPSSAQAQDWEWAEGKQIQDVLWKGLDRVNPAETRDMIETAPGAAFSSETLSLDVARLYRSGKFGSPRAGVAPVAVEVREE